MGLVAVYQYVRILFNLDFLLLGLPIRGEA